MRPGPVEYYKCPNCKNMLSKGSLLSGNTIGAKLFSDGKQIGSMLPEFPMITKCTECDTIFWLNKKTEVKNRNPMKILLHKIMKVKNSSPVNIERARFLTISEYLSALENEENLSNGNENYIRKRIWWLFNDRIRNNKSLFNSENEKAIWTENVNRLIEILNYEDINQRIMIAELNRNLGNFTNCKDILAAISDTKLNWLKELFEKEMENGNKYVFQLN